ncbi:hypothetical protein HDK77DRAFT_456115 [Phyllosticta capitalensis]
MALLLLDGLFCCFSCQCIPALASLLLLLKQISCLVFEFSAFGMSTRRCLFQCGSHHVPRCGVVGRRSLVIFCKLARRRFRASLTYPDFFYLTPLHVLLAHFKCFASNCSVDSTA